MSGDKAYLLQRWVRTAIGSTWTTIEVYNLWKDAMPAYRRARRNFPDSKYRLVRAAGTFTIIMPYKKAEKQ